MHVLIHALINLLLGLSITLNPAYLMALVLGGVIIDIDHIIYMITKGIYTPKKMLEFHKKESKIMRPHFYFMHFIEPILIFTTLSFFINFLLFYFFLGFLLHWFADAIAYIYYYKSANPWINYYSFVRYITRPTNLKTS